MNVLTVMSAGLESNAGVLCRGYVPRAYRSFLRRYRRQSWQSVPQRPAKNDPTRMKSW